MLSLRRSFIKPTPRKSRAPLSILCRGQSIAREELFTYTNGHFLIDEATQLRQRYLQFNLDALCDLAATAGASPSPIRTIEKFEGGFSKALRLTKENGDAVMAKLPLRIAGPAARTTASEVAVLQYVKQYTGIPVPGVLAWSSERTNPVGAEYIIMEKAAGVPLYERWEGMAEIDRLGLIRNLVKLEAQLSALAFPAYGGLYRRVDAAGIQLAQACVGGDSSEQYCVGPSCEPSWSVAATDPATPGAESVSHGPWRTLSDLGTCIAKREISRITHRHSTPRLPFHRGSIEEQTQLLEATAHIIQQIDSHSLIPDQYTQPALWHTDLHMGNIFVAPDDNSRIVSLIDFQSLSVYPLFLHARWPIFLNPPTNYPKGLVKPTLPDEFPHLDEESQALALQEFAQAKLAKAYEVAKFLEDRVAYDAMMNVPRVFRELFVRCGEVSEVGIVPLRECLLEIVRNWAALGFQGECPHAFSEEEIRRHDRQFAEYQMWTEVQQLAMECLDTDAEGWIAPQLDIAEKRRQNRELLAMWIERAAGERSPDEARDMWPFPES